MLVEFDIVLESSKEAYDKNLAAQAYGESSVPFFNQEDKMGKITVDMDTVQDFRESRVWCNDRLLDAVVLKYRPEHECYGHGALVIPYGDFKKLWTLVKGTKIHDSREL